MRTGAPAQASDLTAAIAETATQIAPFIRRTPVVSWDGEPARGRPVSLKLECLQHSGSFKARGAFANLLRRTIPPAGVVAASGGNHGAAVAYAARRLGVQATIFVPAISSPAKIERIRSYGAALRIGGDSYADALAASREWERTSDVLEIHAFDQLETVLGQATLAAELETQLPATDSVLVAVGGGGLVAGVAAWYGRRARVIGVEPAAAPTLTAALDAGRPVGVDGGGIAADSLAPRAIGTLPFEIVRSTIHAALLVSDESIRDAQQLLWDSLRVVAEPGAAAPVAALLSGAYEPAADEQVCVVISGANTTAVNFR